MQEWYLNNNRERRKYWEYSTQRFSPAQIDRGLRSLKPDMQKVLDLYYRKGYTFSQISELMRRTIGQIRNHHNRGIYKLYRYFNPRSPGHSFLSEGMSGFSHISNAD